MAKNCDHAAFNYWNGSYLETQLWHFLCRELWESTQHTVSEIQRRRTPLMSDLRGISPLLTWPACHYEWGRGCRRMPGKSIQTLSLPSNSHSKLFYTCMSVCVCLVCSHEPTAIITARHTDWREAKSDQAEMNLSWHTLFIFPRGFTNVPAWLKPLCDKAIWRVLQWISAGNDTMQMHHLCQRRNLLDLSYSFLKWCHVEFG